MDNDKKRMRVNTKHWDVLLQYLEVHPELITGEFVCQNAKQKSIQLWNEVVAQLNSLGLGDKSVNKWKIALQDWKYKVKRKVAEIKESQKKTGGGPATTVTLTEQEERLMSIVGWTAVGNENIPETGISRPTLIDETPALLPCTSQLVSTHVVGVIPPADHQYVTEENVEFEVITEEPMESMSNEEPSTSSMIQMKNNPQSKKKRKRVRNDNEVLGQYQEETMTVSNDISDSVRNISKGVNSIANKLHVISEFLISSSKKNSSVDDS